MIILRRASSGGSGLPAQGGNGGKFLTTDGSSASWATVGGGTGFDGIVTTHASLPTTVGSPAVNAIYLVRESSGLWFISRKQRGLWQRVGNAGSLSDWQYMGEWLEEFSDANLALYNGSDNTKQFGFDISAVATATKRTATVPNKNFTMAGLDDIPAYSDTNPSAPGTAAQGSSPKISRQDHVHPRQGSIVNAEIDPAAAIALSKLATDPLARGNHTGTQLAATISDFDTQVRTNRLDQMAAPNGNVGMNSQKISSMADGTASGDAVNKSQLDANATADRARGNHTGTQPASTISDFDTQVRTSRLDQMAAPTASVGMNSQKITNLTDPTSAQDAATKAYVDALINGIAPKESVRAATTANITLSGAQTIDGVSIIAGDRVLVKNQSTGAENGIYVAAAGAWSRAADADSAADILSAFCFVEEGSTLADTAWVMTTNAAITLGTTALSWVQFGTSATIADDSVTNAKLANMAASTIKARKTGSTGDPEDCTLSEILDFIGSAAQGDILYRGASDWARLAAGTSGQFLKTQGAGANPMWDTPAGGGGGTKTYAVFGWWNMEPPASNYGTFDTRNSQGGIDFDDTTEEAAVWTGIMPEGASLGSGLKIRIHWRATSATSGNARFGVQLERCNTDIDSDSFDTATEGHSAANGTSGIPTVTEITTTNIDGITAGDLYRLKVYRDVSDTTNDTVTGDVEIVAVEVRSAA